jgi:hypothetical protein
VPLPLVPAVVLAGPVPGAGQTAATVKADVRTMGPPWELRDGGEAPLFSGQESETKALYHVMCNSRSVLHGNLHVCDPQGARFTWDRKTFRWEAALPQLT